MLSRSSILRNGRRIIYKAFLFPPINFVGKHAIKILPHRLSSARAYVFPIRGEVKVDYGRFGAFKMITDGADSIASRAFFADAYVNDAEAAISLTALFLNANCFYDIGANTGLYTLMAMRHSELKEIHAFEPVPAVFSHLERNINGNPGPKTVGHQVAVGRSSGKTSFRIPQGILLPVGSSDHGSQKQFLDAESVELTVDLLSIDDFIHKGYTPPDVIKIDTETTEPDVIAGASETIKKHRPSIVSEILTKEVAESLENFFKPLDYVFFHLKKGVLDSTPHLIPDPLCVNYALIPKEKVEIYKQNLNHLRAH